MLLKAKYNPAMQLSANSVFLSNTHWTIFTVIISLFKVFVSFFNFDHLYFLSKSSSSSKF